MSVSTMAGRLNSRGRDIPSGLAVNPRASRAWRNIASRPLTRAPAAAGREYLPRRPVSLDVDGHRAGRQLACCS